VKKITSKIIFIILLILTLAGCQWNGNTMASQLFHPVPPRMYEGMVDGAPEGTPVFRTGFKDGCESGMSAYGSLDYKAKHEFRHDPELAINDEYHSAWLLGFRHCRWYTASWTQSEPEYSQNLW